MPILALMQTHLHTHKKQCETVALYTLRKAVCKGYVGQQCKLHADWLSPVDGADWLTAVLLFIVL